MSRIGKLPINVPEGVTIRIDIDNIVTVKGKLGQLTQKVDEAININLNENVITVERKSEQKRHKAMHGLYRSLLKNMVEGVSKGFEIKQELVGVGYRASNDGQLLEMSLGYSHNIIFEVPVEVKVSATTEKRANSIIVLSSFDKQLLGQVAAKIRSLRPPEPYKGKGIKFVNEILRRKAGKAASGS